MSDRFYREPEPSRSAEIATTVAETIRRLGTTVNIMLQPFGGHYTGELWTVSINQSRMGQGETLELALVDLATNPLNKGK